MRLALLPTARPEPRTAGTVRSTKSLPTSEWRGCAHGTGDDHGSRLADNPERAGARRRPSVRIARKPRLPQTANGA